MEPIGIIICTLGGVFILFMTYNFGCWSVIEHVQEALDCHTDDPTKAVIAIRGYVGATPPEPLP